eukprot:7691833-Pyramimonas_sp.AAC.1
MKTTIEASRRGPARAPRGPPEGPKRCLLGLQEQPRTKICIADLLAGAPRGRRKDPRRARGVPLGAPGAAQDEGPH